MIMETKRRSTQLRPETGCGVNFVRNKKAATVSDSRCVGQSVLYERALFSFVRIRRCSCVLRRRSRFCVGGFGFGRGGCRGFGCGGFALCRSAVRRCRCGRCGRYGSVVTALFGSWVLFCCEPVAVISPSFVIEFVLSLTTQLPHLGVRVIVVPAAAFTVKVNVPSAKIRSV